MDIDFGRTADDYARYRAGFPPSLFDRLAAHGIGSPGQVIVDVGTGTGTLARSFAARGCRVIGIDPSEAMLDEARRLDREAGVTVDYRVGSAEATACDDGSVDVFTAGQCWHWFDRAAAGREAARVVRPGGAIVVCYLDWLPRKGNVVHATEALILEHNPRWLGAGGIGIHPQWTVDVADAGFVELETFSYDVDLTYSQSAWRGRVRASAGIAASLDPASVERFDTQHAALLRERFDDPLTVPHRVWALVARRPA
jgi:SAM-dependent methyltransferase